jgi:putative hydrolase of the HAD superfamily
MTQINDKVKVIFFDAGGVLFDTPIKGDERIRRILVERGYSKSNINSAILKAKQINLSFITSWTEEEQYYKRFYGTIAKELGEIGLTDELFYLTHFAGNCELFPEVKDVLTELCKDFRLAVISNAMPSMDWIFDKLGIRKYFDSIILSAFVKVEKPSEDIYNIALNRTKALIEESVFIDDKIENIEGAERLGIKGIHLNRDKQNLIELLKEKKILSNTHS